MPEKGFAFGWVPFALAHAVGEMRLLMREEMAFKQHQETLAQLEQDADREIEELKEMQPG